MLQTHDLDSYYLGVRRRLTVWLPPRPRRPRARSLPVLYLNDGQNLFDPARAFAGRTWGVADTASELIRSRRMAPLMIVGIDHGEARRSSEYLPVEDARNPDAGPPLGRRYADFVTREVMPFIERRYAPARGATHTGLGGSSYGAVAALYTALLRPGVFGRLLLESPSLYVGRGYLLRRAAAAGRWPSRVYLGVGTEETADAGINDETVANVRKLEALLRRRGLGPRRLLTSVEPGATHSEDAWAGRLPAALEFLFGSAPERRPRASPPATRSLWDELSDDDEAP
ncbi:MAG: alpha/beta hydrolase-fold protein [Acidobacteriota bacterium]